MIFFLKVAEEIGSAAELFKMNKRDGLVRL